LSLLPLGGKTIETMLVRLFLT